MLPKPLNSSLVQLKAKRGVIVGFTKSLPSFSISSTNSFVAHNESSVCSLLKIKHFVSKSLFVCSRSLMSFYTSCYHNSVAFDYEKHRKTTWANSVGICQIK